jgi:nucleotidyltransferase substrate binding protein (TIGR01987 family)
MEDQDIRWKQRFENLTLAYRKLKQALEVYKQEPNDIIRMALIKAFEMTFELFWKTAKDYLNYNGVKVSLPREVIKQSFAYDMMEDGQVWIDMLEDRNLMAHTYDEKRALQAIDHIVNHYLVAMEQLYAYFLSKR